MRASARSLGIHQSNSMLLLVAQRLRWLPKGFPMASSGVPLMEAWLDVWAFGAPGLEDVLVDITVRHPRAPTYRTAAAASAGATAAKADDDKACRYPPANGAARETWGRLGDSAEGLLVRCAGTAARRDYLRGRVPGPRLRRWRAQPDAALHKAIAAQLRAARYGLPGRSHRRRPNATDAAIVDGRSLVAAAVAP